MFVRDEAPDRAYVQLMKSYKADPASLMRELPRRDEATLNTVAQNLTVILWRDFAELVCGPGRDAESTAVKSILAQRIVRLFTTWNPEPSSRRSGATSSDSLLISCFNCPQSIRCSSYQRA